MDNGLDGGTGKHFTRTGRQRIQFGHFVEGAHIYLSAAAPAPIPQTGIRCQPANPAPAVRTIAALEQ